MRSCLAVAIVSTPGASQPAIKGTFAQERSRFKSHLSRAHAPLQILCDSRARSIEFNTHLYRSPSGMLRALGNRYISRTLNPERAGHVEDSVPLVAQVLMYFRGDCHFRYAGPYIHFAAIVVEAYKPVIKAGPEGQRGKGIVKFVNPFGQLEIFRRPAPHQLPF